MYRKGREPKGYREWILAQGPRPLIESQKLETEADWIAAGRDVFDGMDLGENRTDDPRAFAWLDDSELQARERVPVTSDGIIPDVRFVVDHDGKLKVTLGECAACHLRAMPDGSLIRGAQGNLPLTISLALITFEHADEVRKREGTLSAPNDALYAAYAVPWLQDDINARLKTMPKEELARVAGEPTVAGTFTRFNGSPWFTNRKADLIGVKNHKYLDATATHRNRGVEDIARYGILVTDADDGSIGPHQFKSAAVRRLTSRHSDEAMLALAKFIYSLERPPNPNARNELTARGEQVFARSGCATCHTPPLFTNNKLIAVEGLTPFQHDAAPDPADVMRGVRIGVDSGLALRTRKGTGYYKVPPLKGVWYRGPLEHSGSVAALEDWFDPKRLKDDYVPTGWNPPGVKTRAVPGHTFGLSLPAEDKRALIAFLRTL